MNMQFSQEGETHSFLNKDDELIEASVHFIDIFNMTYDAIATDNTKCPSVHFAEIQINNSGEYRVPSCGDRVIVRRLRGGDFLHERFASGPEQVLKDGRASTDYLKGPRDNQYMRVPPMPGDRSWFAHGGAFLQLLRGGLVKFGASPLCQVIMGKWENFIRIITQNWEFFSTGVNAYSTNKNGFITTAISWFTRDSYGLTFQRKPKEWSLRADFHGTVDINGMGFFAGEVKPGDPDTDAEAWLRKNRLQIQILQDGTVIIDQGKIWEGVNKGEEKPYRQEIILGPYGTFFEHSQWNEKNERQYYEHIQTEPKGRCTRLIKMVGVSRIEVEGTYAIEASSAIKLNALQIEIGKKEGELTKGASNVIVDGAKFTDLAPIHSHKGIEQ